jgi:hypothetical protein
MLRLAARFGNHRKNILQRLLELRNDRFGLEILLRIPADLAGTNTSFPEAAMPLA